MESDSGWTSAAPAIDAGRSPEATWPREPGGGLLVHNQIARGRYSTPSPASIGEVGAGVLPDSSAQRCDACGHESARLLACDLLTCSRQRWPAIHGAGAERVLEDEGLAQTASPGEQSGSW